MAYFYKVMIRVSFRIIPTLPFTALVITTKPSRRAENCMVG